MGAPDAPALAWTVAPCSHARLTALNALFCAGSSISTLPDPVVRPSGGVIAPADGSVLKPAPGTLSKAAASVCGAASYGEGLTFGSGIAPIGFSFARTSSPRSLVAATTWTPIWSGSDHPAASYG